MMLAPSIKVRLIIYDSRNFICISIPVLGHGKDRNYVSHDQIFHKEKTNNLQK